jgi:hypothetical protein
MLAVEEELVCILTLTISNGWPTNTYATPPIAPAIKLFREINGFFGKISTEDDSIDISDI